MSPIISSPGAEYICPSCGKKSKLPLNVPKFGVFKVACFYCKYISEIQFDIQPVAVEEPNVLPESDEDHLNPLYDLPDPFADAESDVSVVAEEPLNQEQFVPPDSSFTDSENPVDYPMDLDSFSPTKDPESIEESSVFKVKEDDKPEPSTPVADDANGTEVSSNALVPYKKLEFSNKFIGKVADVLDIEKISVPEDQYVPIFEVKKIPRE